MKIACLGPEGTFSHEALLGFGPGADVLFCDTIYDCFYSVESGVADFAAVPVENSVDGSVGETLDALLEFKLVILAVRNLGVRHNLLGKAMSGISRLYVQPKAYAQCRKYIRANFPKVEIVFTASNAMSAKLAAGESDGAIAPLSAARIYGRNVLEQNVEDYSGNMTSFALVGKAGSNCSGRLNMDGGSGSESRTFVVFSCVDRPGVLYDILSFFAKRGVSLTKIESRPAKKKMGEYVFYVEIAGASDDGPVKEALADVKKNTVFLKVLGSYRLDVGDVGD